MSKVDPAIDLAKYLDQKVRVRIQEGREVEGILKGFDKLENLVLEDVTEFLRGKIKSLFLTMH
jgi:U6 snRNA-associated Sm-like protein LSm7